jgi:predicted nucleic acid-binding protein
MLAVDTKALVAAALDRVERGMDFADALHLGKASHCDAMITFDRKFIKAAKAVGVETLREA